MENPVRRDITTILGFVFFGASIMLFGLYMYMAYQHKEVVGLKSYHIWGTAIMGLTLIIMPQEDIINLIKSFWKAVLKKVFNYDIDDK
jgi:hypothetical protein